MSNLDDRIRKAIREIDSLIKDGKTAEAQESLNSLRRPFPPDSLVELASLSCRAFVPKIGIRILYPIVHPSNKSPAQATAPVKAEYAKCLVRMGATEEALRLLDSVDATTYPEVLFLQASARAKQWDYEKVISLLTEYLKVGKVSAYQTLVAKVNLAAALVYERRHKEAAPLLDHLLKETNQRDFRLLHMNTLHTLALDALYRGSWSEAKAFLDSEAKQVQSGSLEHFFSRKWYAILEILKDPSSKKASKEIDLVCEEATRLGHWETSRDCDRFRFLATQDPKLFERLYFGTPYEPFRSWLTRFSSAEVSIPESYTLYLGGSGGPSLDLWTGQDQRGKEVMKVGQLLHRLLSAVASDFYSPARLAALHFQLHPGEFYNPSNSPHRMHQALQRFHLWAKKNRLPFEIAEKDGNYRLTSRHPVALIVPRPSLSTKKRNPLVEELRSAWPAEFFSIAEAAKQLNVSKKSIARAIQSEVESGHLEKEGAGRATSYRFNRRSSN